MRAAVYSGTRNVYQDMLPSMKSLLEHSNVEKIYFLIEDDEFPYDLPPEVECINVSNQLWFPQNGPNFDNVCSYMVLLRAAYTKIFPQLDKILTIDNDTVVNENISELWDLDLTNYYLAAAEEEELSKKENSYFNMGVAMLNLKKIREDKKDEEMINSLNTYWYRYKEQDCFNEFFRGNVLILPSDYNCSIRMKEPSHEKITHFAALYKLDIFPHFNYYKNLPLDKIIRNKEDKIDLDIIIPTYKNKKELKRTLNSIEKLNNVNIIVIDDCSNLDYSDILEEYPYITFYQLDENQGPGMARQYGLDHSNGLYITFLDAGDYFYENGLQNILNEINKNTYIKLYSWSYVYDNKKILVDKPDDKTIGAVYKRSFIEMYNIYFCKEGSYANEDYGFSRACKVILHSLNDYGFPNMQKHIKIPVFYEHIDLKSLTKKNNSEFFYTKLGPGIIINGLHAIELARKANVKTESLINEYNRIMSYEYGFFLSIVNNRPEYAEDIWEIIRNFYFNYYRTYIKFSLDNLKLYYSKITLPIIKSNIKSWKNNNKIPMNLDAFIKELEENTFVPPKYYI